MTTMDQIHRIREQFDRMFSLFHPSYIKSAYKVSNQNDVPTIYNQLTKASRVSSAH